MWAVGREARHRCCCTQKTKQKKPNLLTITIADTNSPSTKRATTPPPNNARTADKWRVHAVVTMSVIQPIVDSLVKVEVDGVINTEAFLATCRLILPVFGEHPAPCFPCFGPPPPRP